MDLFNSYQIFYLIVCYCSYYNYIALITFYCSLYYSKFESSFLGSSKHPTTTIKHKAHKTLTTTLTTNPSMEGLSAELHQQELQTRVMSDRICRGYRTRSFEDTQAAIRQAEIDQKLEMAIREAIEEEEKKQKEN